MPDGGRAGRGARDDRGLIVRREWVLFAVAAAIGGCGAASPPPRSKAIPVKPLNSVKLTLAWRAQTLDGRVPSALVMRRTAELVAARLAAGLPRSDRFDGAAARRPVDVRGDVLILPAGLRGATAASVTPLLVTGRLAVIDWEPSVLGPAGRPAPDDAAVTGGEQAGLAGSAVTGYRAVLRASRAPGRRPVHFLVDRRSRAVLSGPLSAVPRRLPPFVDAVAVAGGTALVQAQTPDGAPDPGFDAYYALRARPVLTNADLFGVRAGHDRPPGRTRQPVLSFYLHPAAERRFAELTRLVAARGSWTGTGFPGRVGHFAVLVDDRIMAAPFVDFRRFPRGLGLRGGGEIAGGLTEDQTRALASVLRGGPLPVMLSPVASGR